MLAYIIAALIILFSGLFLTMQKGIEHNEKLFMFVSMMALFILLAFRGATVGEDTQSYLNIAKYSENVSWKDALTQFPFSKYNTIDYGSGNFYYERIETVYLLLNKLIMALFHKPEAVQIVCAGIICIGFAKFIYNNSEDVFFSVWVFMGESVYMNLFNLQRQGVAMAIGLNSVTDIKDSRYKKAVIKILIASLFHLSALLYFFLFVPLIFKEAGRGMRGILILSVIGIFGLPGISLLISRFNPRYSEYLKVSYWGASVGLTAIIWLVEIAVWCVIYYLLPNNRLDYLCVCFIPFYLAMEIIGFRLTMVGRVALYYRALLILTFPCVLKYLKGRRSILLYKGLIFLINFVQFYSYFSRSTRAFSFF